jgi:16S rRNA U516 pseudouridylate synthase RsuA-like enzyme
MIHLEGPVPSENIDFIHEDDEFLVINKPHGIPVQPGEPYYYNSLIHILADEYDRKNLKPCHRLDKATSGICIFAKTSKAAAHFTTMMKSGKLYKYYIAGVHGNISTRESIIEINLPVLGSDKKRILEAKTFISCIFYDSRSNISIVACAPVTGRYHQIRQHLWDIGFPIVGDHQIKKTNFINDAKSYPWEWNLDTLQRCNNDVEMYVRQTFQLQQENFFKHQYNVQKLYLHALRYEKIDKEQILFRYETCYLPEWAENVDREKLHKVLKDLHERVNNKRSDLSNFVVYNQLEWVPSVTDKYLCVNKKCVLPLQKNKTAINIDQRWTREINQDSLFYCTKHKQVCDSSYCITCNANVKTKICNLCSKVAWIKCLTCNRLFDTSNPRRRKCITINGNHGPVEQI